MYWPIGQVFQVKNGVRSGGYNSHITLWNWIRFVGGSVSDVEISKRKKNVGKSRILNWAPHFFF